MTPQLNVVLVLTKVLPKSGKRNELWLPITSRTTLENEPESLINESILLMSIDYSFVKLARNVETNNLCLHPADTGINRRSGNILNT